VTVPDARAALRSWQLARADLVLLAVGGPELRGAGVCRLIRNDSTVPIIAFGRADDRQSMAEALRAGADAYVAAPFTVRQVTSRVRALLGRDRRCQVGSGWPSRDRGARWSRPPGGVAADGPT
jgi:DNA-binding response OmpR family regulator